MARRFELHLEGMDMPAGLIDAHRLVEIVKSLQEMAARVGRTVTDSAALGRPLSTLDRVASLRIGLEKGSTTVVAERDLAVNTLDLDLQDEEATDRRFAELIEGIGSNRRPAWVTDTVAGAADDLIVALQRTAPRVELTIDGAHRQAYRTAAISRAAWQPLHRDPADSEVTFTGRLYAVNLNTHRFHVQDDVGNRVTLPKVRDDIEASRLVAQYVKVVGLPGLDDQGRLAQITDASVESAPDPFTGPESRPSVPLEAILASAPGPSPGGIPGLTDDEVIAFLEAMD